MGHSGIGKEISKRSQRIRERDVGTSASTNQSNFNPDYPTIDPSVVRQSHRFFSLNLDSSDTDGVVYYYYDGIVWKIRMMAAVNGIMVDDLAIITTDEVVMIELKYNGLSTELLIDLQDLYVIAATCDKVWLVANGMKFNVVGGVRIDIDENYPNDDLLPKVIGLNILRSVVLSLNSGVREKWAYGYYRLALNFSECIRSHEAHNIFRSPSKFGVSDFGKWRWIINYWGTMCKYVKLEGRYGVWDPLKSLPSEYTGVDGVLKDFEAAKKVVAVIKNVDISKEIAAVDAKKVFPVKNDKIK